MKTSFCLLFFLFTLSLFGQATHFEEGNAAYASGNYTSAAEAYNKAVGSDILSEALFYNLGNTYFKLGEYGEAIWAYERTLNLNPTNENAIFNLALANQQITQDVSLSEGGITDWLKITFFSWSINFWAYASIIFALILALCLYVFLTTSIQKTKNRALAMVVGNLLLLCLAFSISSLHKGAILNNNEGIIISESVAVYNTPSDKAELAFELHEGNKAILLRDNENWYEIDVNGNVGWIEKQSFWKI